MKSFILLPILLLFWFMSTAQSIKDVQINGVEINEEASLMDDGYMIVDNATLSYLKFDFSGNLVWSKKFDASSLNYLNSVVQSVNGNLFFLGETANYDLILIKTNATGTVLWTKLINRQESSYTMSKIRLDEFENVYLMPSQGTQISYLKFDTNGNELWSTTITCDPLKNPSFHFTILADGSIIGTGKADSDILIYHIDKYGNVVMNRRFGGSFSYEYYCHATIIEPLGENLFLTGGYFQNTNGQSELLLMKTDSMANVIEAKTFVNPVNLFSYLFYVFDCKILSDGTIAVAYDSGNGLAIAYFDQNLNYIKNLYMPDTYYYSFVFTGVSINNDELIVPYYDINGINRLMRFKLLNTDLTCGLIENGNFTSSTYTFNPNYFSSTYTLGVDLISSNIIITSSVITGITYSTYCGVAESELGIIADEIAGEFMVYPNPATQFITIETEISEGSISIYDMQGKIVFESLEMKNTIDVSKFESGIYLVRVVDSNQTFTQKFIKE